MKKTNSIIMLPSNKASILYLSKDGILYNKDSRFIKDTLENNNKPQHLYILSDDEIKEGDWFMYIDLSGRSLFPLQYNKNKPDDLDKKIIATTDKSLGNICKNCNGNGTQELSYKTCFNCNGTKKISLHQLPESFIQAYIKAYNEGKPITEINLEYLDSLIIENNKVKSVGLKLRDDNTVIVHQSKMYSRDEVIELMDKAFDAGYIYSSRFDWDRIGDMSKKEMINNPEKLDFDNWIKENL